MANPNCDPIYSRVGDIQWSGAILTQATTDYTGSNNLNVPIFSADATNGGFCQRLRFKALGTTTSATVARIYINNGLSNQSVIPAPGGAPTGAAHTAATGAVANSATYYARVASVGVGGDVGILSTEGNSGAVTGPTGSVTWTIATPSTTYKIACSYIYVGYAAGITGEYFKVPVSSVTASQSTTTLTVTAILDCPDARISTPLVPGSVLTATGGFTAGSYIAYQLLPLTAGEAMGGIGRYMMSNSANVGSGNCTTDPVKYEQLISPHQMTIVAPVTSGSGAGVPQPCSYDGGPLEYNQSFYGEVSLPSVTASASAATADIDYPMNVALPLGYVLYVGLGTTVTNGWLVTAISGKY